MPAGLSGRVHSGSAVGPDSFSGLSLETVYIFSTETFLAAFQTSVSVKQECLVFKSVKVDNCFSETEAS